MPNLKVLIADDSALYRRILSKAVEVAAPGSEIELVKDGQEVLDRLRYTKFDVVLMDVNMPRKDGLETLSELKPRYPLLPVIIISGVSSKSADLTLSALERGALDFIAKPQGGGFEENMEQIIRPLKALFQQISMRTVRLNSQLGRGFTAPPRPISSAGSSVQTGRTASQPLLSQQSTSPSQNLGAAAAVSPAEGQRRTPPASGAVALDGIDLVVIASSTGGPAALERVICRLPATFNKPILVVQHMPAGFTKALAEKMNSRSAIRVAEAADGVPVRAGLVLIAPGGSHMVVGRSKLVRLEHSEPVNGVRPAADVLFRSVAREYRGGKILSVVLTGMGSDGAYGVSELKNACRCYSITQNESSCVVYGMPRSVVEANLSDEVIDLNRIAMRISEIAKNGTR